MIKLPNRPLAAALAVLATAMAVPAVSAEAQPGGTAITCTNPASGVSWKITIDYDKGTVDANPAQISDAKISWHEPKDGGNYTLDRTSGNLTVIVASSTGGYFLYDRCTLKKSG
jgi:hypothetical protein